MLINGCIKSMGKENRLEPYFTNWISELTETSRGRMMTKMCVSVRLCVW